MYDLKVWVLWDLHVPSGLLEENDPFFNARKYYTQMIVGKCLHFYLGNVEELEV